MFRRQEINAEFHLQSEFATVKVRVDRGGNGPRLQITDRRSGQVGYLDPLELEALAWARHANLAAMLDPGETRWTGPCV